MGALHFLWRHNYLPASVIDKILTQYVQRVYDKYYNRFLENVHLSDQLDVENSSDANITHGQSTASSATNNVIYLLTQYQKSSEQFSHIHKHRSYAHLMAVQEHLMSGFFNIEKVIPKLESFSSDETYMNYLLRKCCPNEFSSRPQSSADTCSDSSKNQQFSETHLDENIFLCSSITLAEWLCIRGESTMAGAALKDAQNMFHSIQQISQDPVLQFQPVRLVMLDMRL